MTRRPRIVIPARFSESASALRFRAEVNARKLIEAVYAAGGEPLTVHPHAPGGTAPTDVAERFDFADAVLLPGGGDLHPDAYGGDHHETLYDMDLEQDAFDLAVARWALESGRPVLAICRGLQVANVSLGGSITAHMDNPHRSVVSDLDLSPGSALRSTVATDRLQISCYHHQSLDRLGTGLRSVAVGTDGTVEAVERDDASWFLGVQWHPEDTAAEDEAQARIFRAFVQAAS